VVPGPGAQQTKAGREIFRGGPDDVLVEDDGLPLRVRTHRGQHARKLPRDACRLQVNFPRFDHTRAAVPAAGGSAAQAQRPRRGLERLQLRIIMRRAERLVKSRTKRFRGNVRQCALPRTTGASALPAALCGCFQPLRAPRCEPVRAGCSPGPPADLGGLAPSRAPAGCGRSMRAGRSRRSGRAGRRSPAASLRPGAPAVCR
jgi:hypothetical protein